MSDEDKDAPFMSRPLCVYKGHASDVLDVSWSKVNSCFLLHMCSMLRKSYFDVKFA